MRPQFTVELFEAEISDFRKMALAGYQADGTGRPDTKISELIERCYAVRRPLVYPWAKQVLETPSGVGAATHSVLPPNSKVLVTGATGFIGGRLVERLLKEHGAWVRCAIRGSGRQARLGRLPVELVCVDQCDAGQIDAVVGGVDYVFHCAHDAQSRRQNIDGLRNLMVACSAHSVRRLIHVSTFAVYEPFPDGPLTEEVRDGDRSNGYVNVKLDLEKMIFDAVKDRGLAATIIQPAIVYGPFSSPWTQLSGRDVAFRRGCAARSRRGTVQRGLYRRSREQHDSCGNFSGCNRSEIHHFRA